MSERIEELKRAVEKGCEGKARHVESTPVREMFKGEIVWGGVVETFEIEGHPKATRCYAFLFFENDQPTVKTVLGMPWIDSPYIAVRVAIAAQSQNKQ